MTKVFLILVLVIMFPQLSGAEPLTEHEKQSIERACGNSLTAEEVFANASKPIDSDLTEEEWKKASGENPNWEDTNFDNLVQKEEIEILRNKKICTCKRIKAAIRGVDFDKKKECPSVYDREDAWRERQ